MTEHDFIAAMQTGLPPLPSPAPLAPALLLKDNSDIAIHHSDAIGTEQDQP
ncbi:MULTISPECIES: hypothetical protein [unclassified Stenotrophomonas]|uniref:hypothetical protein n=1 Tax=unclassified Stenotrophomonas TaxID=196198 RepID=UPI0012FF0F6C|nr:MULTISPECIES: hypothetical protein [unclassified Stenotrophomonas]